MSRLSKDYQYWVICEDKQMGAFMRYFFSEQGIKVNRKVHFDIAPSKTCGEAYVRQTLPSKLVNMHSQNYNRIAIIVFTDADKVSVSNRKQMLIKEIERQGTSFDKLVDCVLMMIPKRNIETWIRHFEDGTNDETQIFSHLDDINQCKNSALEMSRMISSRGFKEHIMSSLADVQMEFDRVCTLQLKRK